MQRIEFNKDKGCYISITTIPDYTFKEVEALMIADGDKESFKEEYGREITAEEWIKKVFNTCIQVLKYRECNASIRDAYMDYMY